MTNPSTPQADQKIIERQKWEYLQRGAGVSDEVLKQLGMEGWELVTALPALGGLLGYLFFKRPLPALSTTHELR